MQLLIYILVVAVVAPIERNIGKGLQTARTIFHRQVFVVIPIVVLYSLRGSHHAQTFALWLQRLDADNGIHLRIIAGTRSRNHVNTLYV